MKHIRNKWGVWRVWWILFLFRCVYGLLILWAKLGCWQSRGQAGLEFFVWGVQLLLHDSRVKLKWRPDPGTLLPSWWPPHVNFGHPACKPSSLLEEFILFSRPSAWSFLASTTISVNVRNLTASRPSLCLGVSLIKAFSWQVHLQACFLLCKMWEGVPCASAQGRCYEEWTCKPTWKCLLNHPASSQALGEGEGATDFPARWLEP